MSGDPQGLVSEPIYSRLKEFLIEQTGLAYYQGRDSDLAYRIAKRMSALGLNNGGAYLKLLEGGESGARELDALVDEIAIGETYFFRHREQFDALRRLVLPAILEKNAPTRRLRVWSAGCANGAELYSVSILLQNEFEHRINGWQVSLLGTDINPKALARAREGLFEEWAFRSTPEEIKKSCFSRNGRSWAISERYKQGVVFQSHNLARHSFPCLLNNLFDFDLILCRNVMIYFSDAGSRRIVSRLRDCLVEGGWLVLGHAEWNPEIFSEFRVVSAEGAMVCRKEAGAGPRPGMDLPDFPPPAPPPLSLPEQPGWVDGVFPAPAAAVGPATGLVFPGGGEPGGGEGETDIRRSPEDAVALRALADRGEWEEAGRLCARMLAESSLNPMVHFYQALIQGQAGEAEAKEEALRRVIYLDRGFVLAHYHLGLVLQQRQPQQAARWFENTLRLCADMDDSQPLVEGDGMTVAELKVLAQMNLEALKTP